MTHALLLLPDFLLIALGFLICRYTALDRPVWEAAERLVYYLLFPVLLFSSIVRNPLEPSAVANLALSGLLVTGGGVVMALALRYAPGVDARTHASGSQVAFRFNSYMALALADRLGGPPALAAVAVLVSVCVPLCNVAAVWPLARHGGHGYLRELARNPLILSTMAGLVCNLMGLRLPEVVGTTMQRIGLAALPLGLMAVGAGLRFGALRESPRLAAALLGVKHVALPLLALVIVQLVALKPVEQLALVAFAALPTATSAYVLAARMGGHGSYVAGLVTVSTLLGMLSLPLALSALGWLRG
jgi:malonate transporter